MNYQSITRQTVDTATPLDFPERRPARSDLTITIKAVVDSFPVELCFTGSIDQLEAITRRLRDLGASPAGVHQKAPEQARTLPNAYYADDGTPVCGNANCSRHGKPMEPSQHNDGYYCKGKDAATGNAKGYCRSKAD